MTATQLELELWDQLQLARQMPEAIDLTQMLDLVEATAAQLPEVQRLQFAGDALLQMAELCAVRAGVLMTEWEESSRDPIVERGFFADVVRQTMAVDLSELIEPAPPRKQRSKREAKQEGSIVAVMEKEAVLAIVDQMEAAAKKEEVWSLAHNEDASMWIKAINQWLQIASVGQVQFAQLCQELEMPQIEVWLGMLLGGFELESQGEFYSGSVLIKGLPSDG